ncbi:MAG: hypothetical protein LBI05_00410 [Planctomycetaceae bacterium]|jgi:hypothetical protein|nr:hypothetical protein [Planctomycetaceae bacterium]
MTKTETKDFVKKKKFSLFTMFYVLLGIICVTVIAAVVFPAPILRYVFSRIEVQSGIAVTFDKAYFYFHEGSFLALDGLTVRRHDHPTDNFDLSAKSVRMSAMVPKDFYSPILLISGLRGTYERVGIEGKKGNHQPGDEDGKIPIHSLMLVDAEVEFIDRTPEKPFQITVQIKEFYAEATEQISLLSPFTCSGKGQISAADFGIDFSTDDARKMEIAGIALGLFAPYAPVLDDIFDSGNMNIKVDDLTDATRKKLRISVTLLPDCRIKSADKILTQGIQAALNSLDQDSLPSLPELKGKIGRLKTTAESLRTELDKVAKVLDTLKVLAPPNVRNEYEKFKKEYDRTKATYDEQNVKFETLLRDLDRVKVSIVEDTFQRFLESGVPIEIDLQEEGGEWNFDAYETVTRLVEKNYRTILTADYDKRIREMCDAVDRVRVP